MMRALLVKTGHTETFDLSHSPLSIVSLGDVLRTTVILHLLKDYEVTWLTSPEALPLLEKNHFIHHLTVDPTGLSGSHWDIVINLEKTSQAMELLKVLRYKRLIGFDKFSKLNTFDGVFEYRNTPLVNWSEKLFFLMARQWKNEEYLFFPAETKSPQFDLGLNWKVGPKWASKSWPESHWENVYQRVMNQYQVSWQEGFDNLSGYIAWIQSCRILLTHDSLGLHLGLALGKKMVALFGPTLSTAIPLKNTIVLSQSENSDFSCPPCYKQLCHNKIHCVGDLSVGMVALQLEKLLQEDA